MHQQAAGADRVPVEDIALLIGADVHPVDQHLAVLDDTVGILQVDVALADGFDLRAAQLEASLEFFLYKVVVIRLAVGGNLFDSAAVHGTPPLW